MIIPAQDLTHHTFDYVIAGGGTAGLTLAARLTEDPNINVLVLEAGLANIDDMKLLLSGIYGSHFKNDSYAWDFMTSKQKYLNGRETLWARGKGLGGSSGINFLCYNKPPARDLDDFERLGNPGWNWEEMSKYFKRLEGFTEPSAEYKRRTGVNFETWNVGRQGPLKISLPATLADAEIKWQQAYMNNGFTLSEDPLGGKPSGVSYLPCTYDPETRKRSYSTTAYYLPNKDRPNFKVAVGARVNRVITEKSRNGKYTAVGVEFEDTPSGDTYIVNAKKEVILSAGALKTPQILELSGFGRKEVLNKIGVPMKVELPGVGENVQDHYHAGVCVELKDDIGYDTFDVIRDPATAAKHLELLATGSGVHTTGIVGFLWAPFGKLTTKERHNAIYAKMQEAYEKIDEKTNPGVKEVFRLRMERFDPANTEYPFCEFINTGGFFSLPNTPKPGKQYISILAAINSAFSAGTVHSTSADPSKNPEYDPHYLEHECDVDILVEMGKFARKVANTEPLKDLIASELNPGAEVQTDEQWAEWVRSALHTTFHASSTCSMLPREKHGVVDPELRVYGTNNLRVVDLSIVPLHFGSHPQSVVYCIAEKAADIIKAAGRAA